MGARGRVIMCAGRLNIPSRCGECESCFSYTVDPHWYEKYNAAVKEYKSRMGLPDDFANMKDLRVCLGADASRYRREDRSKASGVWELGERDE